MRLVTNNNRIKTQILKKKHVSNVPVKSYAKSYVKWTAEEDAIILNERENGVYGYALRAATKLEGRDVQSILDRWNKTLKKVHISDAPVKSYVKWTAEEDGIILRERENKAYGYALRAADQLDGRDTESVKYRWKKTLKKIHLIAKQSIPYMEDY